MYAIISLYGINSSKHEQFAQGYSLHPSSRFTDSMQIPALHLFLSLQILIFSFHNFPYFLDIPYPFSNAYLTDLKSLGLKILKRPLGA